GLSDKVELLGAVDHDQLPALIATATVCVVPSAASLTPNPAVVYPTKLLEYMACKRAVVAPRRDTVQLVVDGGREALLFEPGDPIDLARKVLRLLGEPLLRDRIAAAGYDRVRRDFTASAARRALRHAYSVIAERFGDQFSAEPEDDEPKVEMLADDDFEATVFEEAPQVAAIDTALNEIGEPGDEVLDELNSGHTSSNSVVAPPPPADLTMERLPVAPPPVPGGPGVSGDGWTQSQLTTPAAAAHDDWVVTNVAQAVRVVDDDDADDGGAGADDGTPVEGTSAAPANVMSSENSFVAGEIDVPTPAPEGKTPPVEFTAASKLLGNAEPTDPDTGSHTPPLQRRSS